MQRRPAYYDICNIEECTWYVCMYLVSCGVDYFSVLICVGSSNINSKAELVNRNQCQSSTDHTHKAASAAASSLPSFGSISSCACSCPFRSSLQFWRQSQGIARLGRHRKPTRYRTCFHLVINCQPFFFWKLQEPILFEVTLSTSAILI